MPNKWGIRKIAEAIGFSKKDHSGHKHDCKATLERVMLALDGELSETEEKVFLDELNCCSWCLDKFEIEKSFKEYLCDKVKRHTVSSLVVDQIRAKIHNVQE
ncbi:MAG: hypothetical protein LH473_02050 [Chitinophagales bacterium]|nr:hypothetical protein [Chitinophagales bacterium]